MNLRFRYDKGVYQAAIRETPSFTVILLADDPGNTWRSLTNTIEQVSQKVLEFYQTTKPIMWYQVTDHRFFSVFFAENGEPNWYELPYT